MPRSARALRPGSQRSSSRSQLSLRLAGHTTTAGIRAVGLQRGERLDRLAEALLVGEKRAALSEQVAHPGALKRLQLAAQTGDVQVGVGRG